MAGLVLCGSGGTGGVVKDVGRYLRQHGGIERSGALMAHLRGM